MSSLRTTELRTPGEVVVASLGSQLATEISTSPVDDQTIFAGAVKRLSHLVPGMWVGLLMNDDPTTSRVVVADERAPVFAAHVDTYLETLYAPRQAITTGLLSQRVIESGEPMLMPHLSLEEFLSLAPPNGQSYLTEHPYPVPIHTVGVLIAPMRSLGATMGTLSLFQFNEPVRLTKNDLGWFQQVADQVAVAIDHVQLHATATDRQERLVAVTNIALIISSAQDLRVTLDSILEQLTARLKVDAADVLLVDESATDLHVALSTGFHSRSIPDYRFPISAEVSARLVNGPRAQIPTEMDWIGQHRRRSLLAREGFQAYRLAPLVMHNVLIGAIEVFHRSPLEPDREWLGFLEALANHAAIAIDYAALRGREQAGDDGKSKPGTAPIPELSVRQRQIIGLILDGATNQEIADRLHISHNTVKFHVRQLLEKAGAANRTDLAVTATRLGWLPSD
jgi:DNA-binding CsgD family transcriptional regulator